MYLTLGDSMQSEITRRGLMKTAALLPLAGARGTAANPALTVGLIGSGGRGRPSSGTSRMGRRFRVNEVEQRLARRFVEMDSHAAGLGARGLQNAHQLVTQL